MREISIREMRSELARIEEVVEREGEVVITRNGRPLVKLVPLERKRAVPSHADLRASLPKMNRSSAELIREDRDARG